MMRAPSALLLLLLLLQLLLCVAGASSSPPRGWNSWNSFLQWASAADLLAQAEAMETTGLRAVNFSYVVADGGWYYDPACGNDYTCEQIDEYGRLIPDQGRYPDGWKGLCDQLHARGFKCGFHLFRGVPGLAYTRATPIKGSAEGFTVADAGFSPTSNNSGIGPVQGHGAFFEINIEHPAATQYLGVTSCTAAGESISSSSTGWGAPAPPVSPATGRVVGRVRASPGRTGHA
jgi:hypothetical protein